MKKLWTKQYIFSVLLLFTTHIGPYLLISVISIFAKQLTGSDTYAGMMASVFALSGLIARFLSSYLLDKFSTKKILILSESIMVIASFIYVFCQNYWLAFALRGIQGFGYSMAVTAMSTYIVEIVPMEYRLEGIGYSSLTSSLANVVGPAMAFVIIGEKYTHFTWLFIIVAITSLVSLMGYVSLQDASKEMSEKQVSTHSIKWKHIVIPFVVLFVINLANSAPSSLLSLYAIEKGFTNIGLYFSISAIGLLCSRVFMSRLIKFLGNEKSVVVFSCLFSLSLLAVALVTSVYLLYAVGFVIGFSTGILLPLINTIIINKLPHDKVGLGNALFFAAGDIGFIIGATLWGTIAGISSYSMMFIIVAVVSLMAVGLSLLPLKRQ